jgi:hypothetical protein
VGLITLSHDKETRQAVLNTIIKFKFS